MRSICPAKENASLRDGFGERRDSLPLTPLPTRGFGAAVD